MRPNGEEILRGVQSSLATYVLPEVQTAHAQLELALMQALLGIVADEWDGAAQRLADDNAALRELAQRGADAHAAAPDTSGGDLADELSSLAGEEGPSLRLSDLSAANGRLRAALARLGAVLQDKDTPALQSLRAAVIDGLRRDVEARSLSLLGPRADG